MFTRKLRPGEEKSKGKNRDHMGTGEQNTYTDKEPENEQVGELDERNAVFINGVGLADENELTFRDQIQKSIQMLQT